MNKLGICCHVCLIATSSAFLFKSLPFERAKETLLLWDVNKEKAYPYSIVLLKGRMECNFESLQKKIKALFF